MRRLYIRALFLLAHAQVAVSRKLDALRRPNDTCASCGAWMSSQAAKECRGSGKCRDERPRP